MKPLAVAAAVVAVLLSSTAFAAAPKQAAPKPQVIDFGERVIKGDVVRPELSPVLSYRRASFASLLKTRADFLPELEKSVDGL